MTLNPRISYLNCRLGLLTSLFVLGLAQGSAADGITCANSGKVIQPVQYTVALLLDWMQSSYSSATGAQAIQVPVAVFVKTTDDGVFPLVLTDRSHVLAQCVSGGPRGNGALYPIVKISPGFLDAPPLVPFLQSQLRSGELGKYDAVALRQSGNLAFLTWPAGWHYVPGAIQKLIDDYFDASTSDYLANYPSQLAIEPPRSAGKIKQVLTGGSSNPESANMHAGPGSGQQRDPSVGPDLRGPQDHGQTQIQPAGPSYEMSFVISFARSEWRDIKLDNNSVKTFGYCSDQIKSDGLKYTLQCQQASDGKVPILIQGFKLISVSRNETALDDRLEFDGFRTPYPSSWGRPSTEYVEVSGGHLSDVFGRTYRAEQGVQGTTACADQTKPVTIAAVMQRALSFPDPPCRRYEVAFDAGITSPSTRIVSGCLAGAGPPVAVQSGKAICWYRRDQGASFKLNLDLLPGFGPISEQLTPDAVSSGVRLTFPDVASRLAPVWPFRGA